MQTKLKPGYKTSEFLLSVAAVCGLIVNAIPAPEHLEGKYAAWIIGAYTIARGLAKLAPPKDEAVLPAGDEAP